MIKQGNIIRNNKHEDKIAASHPLIQISTDTAIIMSSKSNTKSGSKSKLITQEDVIEFQIKNESYATDYKVHNTTGKCIGKIKENSLQRILRQLFGLFI